MNKKRINIIILESSDIIYEGMLNILLKANNMYHIFRPDTPDELSIQCKKTPINIAIINPILLINRISDFIKLKKDFPSIIWLSLKSSYINNNIEAKFNDSIGISDSSQSVIKKIHSLIEKNTYNTPEQETLTEREIEILIELTRGLSNKEIADTLSISIHTVISHRKNIIEKTGIKTLPGLTIYAITKKLIPLR